jgi:ABC-type multidrug transport system fused ATPase/permease subunit
MTPLGLLIPIAAARNAHSGIQIWQVVVAVSAVVSLVAGVLAIVDTVRRRRSRKLQDELFKAMAMTVDAKAAAEDVAEYEALRETLRQQVENEVPREGRRVYLRARIEDLRRAIDTNARELDRLRNELTGLDEPGKEPLDERLRAVVEDSIGPDAARHRRARQTTLLVLVVLMVLVLGSLDVVGAMTFGADAITNSADATSDDVLRALIAGSLAVAAILTALLEFLNIGHRAALSTRHQRKTTALCAVIACLLLAGGALESNHASTLAVRAYGLYGLHGYDSALNRANHADTIAALLLWTGMAGLGGFVALAAESTRTRTGLSYPVR